MQQVKLIKENEIVYFHNFTLSGSFKEGEGTITPCALVEGENKRNFLTDIENIEWVIHPSERK